MVRNEYGPPETAAPEIKEIWRTTLKETEAKYPIGHPTLVNEAKRVGVSQEETQRMIAHEIYLERRHTLIEKWREEYRREEPEEQEEEFHHSPVSAHCEDVLARPPKCEDFAKIRSFVMCRAWDLMEKEKRTKLPVSEAWQEARKVCTRE